MAAVRDVTSAIALVAEAEGAAQSLPHLDGVHIEYCPVPEIWKRLKQGVPDAVIATACDELHTDLFNALHESYTAQERPAIILLLHDLLPDSDTTLVDAVLPCLDHPLIGHQIRHAIRQKAEFAHLQSRVTTLETARRQEVPLPPTAEVELLKNVIVRNVTHELNTPLLQVKAAVSLLAEQASKDSIVDLATLSIARLEGVVRNITLLAASIDEMHMAPMIVRESIDLALRNLRRASEDKDRIARVQVLVESDLPPAHADQQGIAVTLQQLIDNALKFSEKHVEVMAQRKGDRIHIQVRDYGVGIPPDHLDKIFDSFYQIDPSDTRPYGGIGVGLAITRLVLDRHGIDIHVKSKVGSGSTFSFALPVVHLDS